MSNQQISKEGLSELCADMARFVSDMEQCMQSAKRTVDSLGQANLGGDTQLPAVQDNFKGCILRSNNFAETVQQKLPQFKELLENARARKDVHPTPTHGPNHGSDKSQRPRGCTPI
jgi:hypothetical protein